MHYCNIIKALYHLFSLSQHLCRRELQKFCKIMIPISLVTKRRKWKTKMLENWDELNVAVENKVYHSS